MPLDQKKTRFISSKNRFVGIPRTGDEFPKVQIFGEPLPRLTLVIRKIHTGRYVMGNRRPSHTAMRSRDAARTRERLVRAAFQEMYRTGFRSPDLNAILAAGRVTKGTLCYHFVSKEAPGYTVVDEVLVSISREKSVWLLQNATNPLDAFVAESSRAHRVGEKISSAGSTISWRSRSDKCVHDSGVQWSDGTAHTNVH